MNIRIFFTLTVFNIASLLFGQEINIFTLKHTIYDAIIADCKKDQHPNLEINYWIDAQTIQFEEITFDPYGLKFKSPYEVDEKSYCELKTNVFCTNKITLEMMEIPIIYQNNLDHLYPIQYMIHQPLDAWYILILHLNKKKYLQDYEDEVELKIPLKKLYIKNNHQKTEYYLYTFTLDKNLAVKNMTKIKF